MARNIRQTFFDLKVISITSLINGTTITIINYFINHIVVNKRFRSIKVSKSKKPYFHLCK